MVDYKTGSSQIRYIFKKLYLSSKIARWQMLLVEYDIEYMTRKTVKGSVIIDYLADNTIDDYEPLNFDFLDEDVLVVKKKEPDWWTTYFDEAVNVYGNETGVMMISHNRNQYPILSSYSLSAPII
jgi:hypothetical protein